MVEDEYDDIEFDFKLPDANYDQNADFKMIVAISCAVESQKKRVDKALHALTNFYNQIVDKAFPLAVIEPLYSKKFGGSPP